jgi:hypothetical protein
MKIGSISTSNNANLIILYTGFLKNAAINRADRGEGREKEVKTKRMWGRKRKLLGKRYRKKNLLGYRTSQRFSANFNGWKRK